MTLITQAQLDQLLANGRAQRHAIDNDQGAIDFKPVVKLLTPDAQCTWLLTELDPHHELAFGLFDWQHPYRSLVNDSYVEVNLCYDRREDVENTTLGAVDPTRIATALCIMRVDVLNMGQREKSRNDGFDVLSIDHVGIQHHALRIIGAEGQ
jgi:hypothetical protein